VLSAASALALDFVPLFDEQYDLVVPIAHLDSDHLAPLLDVLRSAQFRTRVGAIGGYGVDRMGGVRLVSA
jgi:putative molybdopterin biosynthesis protein